MECFTSRWSVFTTLPCCKDLNALITKYKIIVNILYKSASRVKRSPFIFHINLYNYDWTKVICMWQTIRQLCLKVSLGQQRTSLTASAENNMFFIQRVHRRGLCIVDKSGQLTNLTRDFSFIERCFSWILVFRYCFCKNNLLSQIS